MPSTTVNGVSIAYQVFGSGPPLVWTEGGRFGRNEYSYLVAGHFARRYSVLLWDRRNALGASDVALSDDPSLMQTDVEDLYALVRRLGLGPAVFAGASAGCSTSLWMAHRYPEAVKALVLLWAPTADRVLFRPGVEQYCFRLAEAAERGGMQGAVDASFEVWMRHLQGDGPVQGTWLAQTIQRNPANRARILAIDPQQFAQTYRRWGEYILSMSWPAGLTEDDVASIPFPALVVPGDDEVHPRDSAERLCALLRRAEWAEIPVAAAGEDGAMERFYAVFPVMEAFLARALPA